MTSLARVVLLSVARRKLLALSPRSSRFDVLGVRIVDLEFGNARRASSAISSDLLCLVGKSSSQGRHAFQAFVGIAEFAGSFHLSTFGALDLGPFRGGRGHENDGSHPVFF